MKPKEFETKKNEFQKIAMKVSIITIFINLVLSLIKIVAGIVANSSAMISDAVHSASDVFSTLIVMVGVTISSKESDVEHPYGHERMECIASLILGMVLFLTGISVGYKGIATILGGNYKALPIPGALALVAAVLSIVIKELMYWFTRGAAIKIRSGALMADAWHHRSDALSSVGALVGIAGARLGYPVLDSVASVGICVCIIKVSFDIFKDAIDKLVDKACDTDKIQKMEHVIEEQEGVLGIDSLQTRLFGAKIYVDVEIEADGELPLIQAHEVAERVHQAIEMEFPEAKHCMVHVNPVISTETKEQLL